MPVSEIIKCLCSMQYGIDIFLQSSAEVNLLRFLQWRHNLYVVNKKITEEKLECRLLTGAPVIYIWHSWDIVET
jgi:hypothetical protein